MDRTYTFTVQVDAPRGIKEKDMALAIYRAIEYAKENGVDGAECLGLDVGQVTVL